MIDLLSVASGSTYQHSSQRTRPPSPVPRPLHPAASLFVSSSQVRSRSFLTTVALPQFGLLIHHSSVNKQDDLDSHCRRFIIHFCHFLIQSGENLHTRKERRGPHDAQTHTGPLWAVENHLGAGAPPPHHHTTYADFHHIHHHAGPRTTAALTQACRSQRQPQFLF